MNGPLTDMDATFVSTAQTSANDRLYALSDSDVPKPGLVRDEVQGSPIELELWSLPTECFGRFMQHVRYPLSIGSVELSGGNWVHGFLCDPAAVTGATEITHHGGWRAALRATQSPAR